MLLWIKLYTAIVIFVVQSENIKCHWEFFTHSAGLRLVKINIKVKFKTFCIFPWLTTMRAVRTEEVRLHVWGGDGVVALDRLTSHWLGIWDCLAVTCKLHGWNFWIRTSTIFRTLCLLHNQLGLRFELTVFFFITLMVIKIESMVWCCNAISLDSIINFLANDVKEINTWYYYCLCFEADLALAYLAR